MALGSMPSRIRDLQLEAASEQDWERRNRERAEAEAMLAEEEASVGPRPAPMVAPPKGVPVERGGFGPAPLGDARLGGRPKPDASGRNAVVGQEKVGEAIGRGLQAVGDFAGSVGAAAAGVMKPGRMQELAKPVADGMEQLGQTMDSAEGRAFADKVEDSNARRDRGKQMSQLRPSGKSWPEYDAAKSQFEKLWLADQQDLEDVNGETRTVSGAIRSTYTTEDGGPDFDSFVDDMVEPGEDPRVALGRVMQNIASRDGGKDGMGRTMRGYQSQANQLEGPAAVTKDRAAELKARGYKTPTSIRHRTSSGPIKGVDRADKGVAINMSGGEDGTGAMVPLGAGMPSAANAHELAGDGQPDREQAFTAEDVAAGNFPTTLDGFAKLLQSGSLDDASETAVVMHLAQQMGYDMSGVPEEDQYNFAQRVVAHNMFRYGDPAQKEWAKSWGSLTGDRYHISKQINPETGKRDKPIADGPMRASVWVKDPGMPGGGYFKDTATQEARGKAQRLQDVAAARANVRRGATNPDSGFGQTRKENIAELERQMGADNWANLTPGQQAKFLGELERGRKVQAFNEARGQAQRRGLTGNAATIGAQYSMEMDAAETPLQKLAVAHKHGDPQGIELWSQVVAGDQGIAAAAAGARPGEPSPATEAGKANEVQTGIRKEAGARGDVDGALQAAGWDGSDATKGTASATVASDEVEEWKASGDNDPQGLILAPRMQPYLRHLATTEFDHAFFPGFAGGEIDWGFGSRSNPTMAKAFAERVIADRGLQGIEGMEQALIDWWRGHHGFTDAYVPGAAAPPGAKPPTSTGMGAVAAPGAPPTRGGSIGF